MKTKVILSLTFNDSIATRCAMIAAIMRAHGSSHFSQLSSKIAAVVSLLGSIAILVYAVAGYLERDVFQLRGIVLSLILLGVAAIVWTEKPTYASTSRHHRP